MKPVVSKFDPEPEYVEQLKKNPIFKDWMRRLNERAQIALEDLRALEDPTSTLLREKWLKWKSLKEQIEIFEKTLKHSKMEKH